MSLFSKKFIIGTASLGLLLGTGAYWSMRAIQATAEIESFPEVSHFDHSTGTQLATDINNISFIGTIKNDADTQQSIVAFDEQGKGGIITYDNGNTRTFTGLNFSRTPTAQLSYDVTNDQKEDLISILPGKWIDSKTWHRARVLEVGSNYLVIDQLIRKDILTQGTVIAKDGKQYAIRSNTGPTDPSPRNAIYLDKQITPSEESNLGDYRSRFVSGEYISYLAPTKVISENPKIVIAHNLGNHNFEIQTCTPYLPQNIDTITSLAVGRFDSNNTIDLDIITHQTEEMSSSNVTTNYASDSHTLTFTIAVPPNAIHSRNLTGSYVSFMNSPEKLFPIRAASSNQLIVDLVLPDTGEGVDNFQTALLPGGTFLMTSNTDDSKHDLIYSGDGRGCFSYTGEMKGVALENSYGKVLLPNATALTSDSRSVITDLNANFLPINSLAGRKVRLGSQEYTIEANDQYHIFLTPQDGDISQRIGDILHQHQTNEYSILASTTIPTADTANMQKITTLVVDVPSSIQAMIGGTTLEGGKPMVRAIDIDHDGDKDLIYLNNQHIFLKKNNEISS